jgi:hypothetical protein
MMTGNSSYDVNPESNFGKALGRFAVSRLGWNALACSFPNYQRFA